jgi:transcriptional regulator with XRE-family HTH domain
MENQGRKISEARKLKGLTQEQLAEQAKVNLRTIQRIEANETNPRSSTLKLICDVLDLNPDQMVHMEKSGNAGKIGVLLFNGFFLLVLNFVMMAIFGYLTLDSNANWNSRLGALLLSFFIPYFVVLKTRDMNGLERMLKFGTGFIVYLVLVLFMHGFRAGLGTGIFVVLPFALGVLFYGSQILNLQKR